MRILIVDDDVKTLLMLQKMLVKTGHDIMLAQDSRNALTLIDHQNYDILMVDLKMPYVSGLEIIKRMRLRSPDTAIIAMTGGVSDGELKEVRQQTPIVLFKPFSKGTLTDCLERTHTKARP